MNGNTTGQALPNVTKLLFFSSSSIDSQDIHVAISALLKQYPALDPSVFGEELNVTTQTKCAFDDGPVFLPRQGIATIKTELPKAGVGGVMLDYYFNQNSRGKCQDQLIVFWEPGVAKAIIEAIPQAIRL